MVLSRACGEGKGWHANVRGCGEEEDVYMGKLVCVWMEDKVGRLTSTGGRGEEKSQAALAGAEGDDDC